MAVALFALGMTAGMLVLLIGFTIVPEHTEPTTREFEAIRSFAESHFVSEIDDDATERAFTGCWRVWIPIRGTTTAVGRAGAPDHRR